MPRGYLGLAGSPDTGSPPRFAREQLTNATAQSTTGSYCLSAHSYSGHKAAGLSVDQVAAACNVDADDAETGAIMSFAVAVHGRR